MKVKDKLEEIVGINEELINKFLEFNQVGSFFNFIEDAVNELHDKDLSEKFKELQELIIEKREEIGNKELEEKEKWKKVLVCFKIKTFQVLMRTNFHEFA